MTTCPGATPDCLEETEVAAAKNRYPFPSPAPLVSVSEADFFLYNAFVWLCYMLGSGVLTWYIR